MARPTKLTHEVSEKIVRAIRAGNYPEVAGPPRDLLPLDGARRARGSAPEDDPFRHFRLEVERAIADAEAAEVGLVLKAARDGDWRAAAWLLERRFSERWGRGEPPVAEADDRDDELDRDIERLLEEMTGRDKDAD